MRIGVCHGWPDLGTLLQPPRQHLTLSRMRVILGGLNSSAAVPQHHLRRRNAKLLARLLLVLARPRHAGPTLPDGLMGSSLLQIVAVRK